MRPVPRPKPIILKPQTTPTATEPADAAPVARPAKPKPPVAATQQDGNAVAFPVKPAKPKSAVPSPSTHKAPAKLADTPKPAGPTLGAPGPVNRSTIVLDPAHGGVDSGSRIGDSILEKDVALALAFKLRSLLSARGFTVVMTRDSDVAAQANSPEKPLTLDDRAGIANHARASACLLLHATGSGVGVHLYSSELAPAPAEASSLPWLTAQAAWATESQHLSKQLGTALTRAGLPLVASAASIRPVDSLTCPALVLEVAPQNSDPGSINDAAYQQHIAEAVAAALVFWQNQMQPPPRLLPPPAPKLPKPAAATAPDPAGAQP